MPKTYYVDDEPYQTDAAALSRAQIASRIPHWGGPDNWRQIMRLPDEVMIGGWPELVPIEEGVVFVTLPHAHC